MTRSHFPGELTVRSTSQLTGTDPLSGEPDEAGYSTSCLTKSNYVQLMGTCVLMLGAATGSRRPSILCFPPCEELEEALEEALGEVFGEELGEELGKELGEALGEGPGRGFW